jgi:hypothetical protein
MYSRIKMFCIKYKATFCLNTVRVIVSPVTILNVIEYRETTTKVKHKKTVFVFAFYLADQQLYSLLRRECFRVIKNNECC